MSSKQETTFIGSVHRHMPPIERGAYRMKNYNIYNGGIADVWYSGLRDLWVEYKFIALPKRGTTLITPDMSELQLEWCRDRFEEGRNIAVVVGCKEGGVLYVGRSWEKAMTTQEFRARLFDRKTLATRLLDLVNQRDM